MQYPKTPNREPLHLGPGIEEVEERAGVAGDHVRRHRPDHRHQPGPLLGIAEHGPHVERRPVAVPVVHVGQQHRVALVGECLGHLAHGVADAARVDVHDDPRPRAGSLGGVQGDGAGAVWRGDGGRNTRHASVLRHRSGRKLGGVPIATPYEDLLRVVLDRGTPKSDRTGTGTRSLFGHQLRYDLAAGFPLITTKKVHLKSVIYELLWFLRGDSNVRWLQDHGVTIWDEWASETGDLGPVYGVQWRSWPTPSGEHVDQISAALELLKSDPDSRRNIVSAWNVGEIPQMALPPCHAFFQFYVADGRLSCQLYQRSADLFLGVPFNIASYALLTHMMAAQAGLDVGEFVWTGGDCHIYDNHRRAGHRAAEPRPAALPGTRSGAAGFDLRLHLRRHRHQELRATPGDQGTRSRMTVGLIWAQSPSGVIGRAGGIPWRLPEDLARFKELTMGHTVVMGRLTWESLPPKVRPLPGRRNVVVTRQADYMAEGATVVGSLDEALTDDVTWVIGGEQIYTLALPVADPM